LVAGGGQAVGQVAQVVLDLAERLVLGEIDEALGHRPQGVLGMGAEAGEEVLEARFAVFAGLRRG
jgi:hypothetical protein